MTLLAEIEAFLAETGMPDARFGKHAANNAVLVRRLRNGCDVMPQTADRVRAYIAAERANPTPPKQSKTKDRRCGCGASITHKAVRCRSCASKELAKAMLRPVPADFQEIAPGKTINELQRIYSAGPDTVVRWRKEAGIVGPRKGAPASVQAQPEPRATVPRKPRVGRFRQVQPRPLIDHRDISRAGLAAQFLQRFGQVIRCDADGSINPKGTHWLRGGRFVLTDNEIMQRAERNGWRPDQWKELARPAVNAGGAARQDIAA
ncbi:hypothetical protein [Sphingomonas turrisvirgatae]|uniref:Uncharacterized protein n=1 Tax=Sphingomonas turrisvirgatae TaxID=1888892 RepID=A0A1E3M1P6_9SPHN|nr:hypothetical protein [Sphingomonas turrisvirgatae]ODP39275.1 hypothetical protein BFL28_10705 [Sphingomonas turrisvirgatae]